jgi:hypothetical protein
MLVYGNPCDGGRVDERGKLHLWMRMRMKMIVYG